MNRGFRLGKVLMIILVAIAAIFLFGFIVMNLWNAILPAVLHVGTISFWQALGILLLSKILFGGFHGGWRGGRHRQWKQKMNEKWMSMTPEEKQKFQQEWRSRCGSWGRTKQAESSSSVD